jgi:predicted DsbA family dithiol-disulfide isomerase
VRWLPFQLNPDLPERGIPREEYVARKFGARGPAVYARVTKAGEGVGIPFAYEKMRVQPNTLQAHRLMVFAQRAGRQNELAEELFRAHFVEGADLTDPEVLASAAARAGLEHAAAAAYLAGGEDRELVARADLEARAAGIQGVPFFIFNRRIGLSGAQEAQTLLAAMEEALEG